MDWKQYEILTKYVYETLGKKADVKILGFGNDCKVTGKNGVKHQIDVLTSHTDGIHNYRTAIECKFWKAKVDKDTVMKLHEVIIDADIEKGVIVSKSGFTSDAISIAKSLNIGLIELRESKESEKVKPIVNIVKSEILRPVITNVIISYVDKDPGPEVRNLSELVIEFPDGRQINLQNLVDSFKRELHNEELFKKVRKRYDFHDSKLIDLVRKAEFDIFQVELIGMLTTLDNGLKFHIIDQVWWIMKNHFENTNFAISDIGKIRKM